MLCTIATERVVGGWVDGREREREQADRLQRCIGSEGLWMVTLWRREREGVRSAPGPFTDICALHLHLVRKPLNASGRYIGVGCGYE